MPTPSRKQLKEELMKMDQALTTNPAPSPEPEPERTVEVWSPSGEKHVVSNLNGNDLVRHVRPPWSYSPPDSTG